MHSTRRDQELGCVTWQCSPEACITQRTRNPACLNPGGVELPQPGPPVYVSLCTAHVVTTPASKARVHAPIQCEYHPEYHLCKILGQLIHKRFQRSDVPHVLNHDMGLQAEQARGGGLCSYMRSGTALCKDDRTGLVRNEYYLSAVLLLQFVGKRLKAILTPCHKNQAHAQLGQACGNGQAEA